jgi:predicted homoserine dehydrogenase-like protein
MYVLLIAILLQNNNMFSQSALQVLDIAGTDISNTTINLSIDYFDQVSFIMDVKNISTSTKNIKMKKQIITDLAGTILQCALVHFVIRQAHS